MAYKFREELVGKRFLSISGFAKLKVNKISEWGWRAGVIRAASTRDNLAQDLQVLVEYDDVEWHRREWLSPHRDLVFSFFLIERGINCIDRPDPKQTTNLLNIERHNNANNNQHQPRLNGKYLRGSTSPTGNISWPALTFYPLVARAELPEDEMPIEFMQDRKLEFVDYSKLKPLPADWEMTKGSSLWGSAVRQWAEMQDGQSILLTTPSVLVGFRVEVYRAEGTTQWYTAVIVGYNESTKDLTVTDDTVLEDHSEDPRLLQMRLIGDGVVESIMRGEVVGMTPRRSRSSTALVMPRSVRRPRGRPGSTTQLQSNLRSQSLVTQQQLEKEKGNNVRTNRKRLVEVTTKDNKSDQPASPLQASPQEDRENKGPLSGKQGNRTQRTVLEETNTSSLPTVTKLRKRLKNSSETLPQRPVRRRTRLETKLFDEDSEESEDRKLEKKQRLPRKSVKDENEQADKEEKAKKSDLPAPLIKRLRAVPERLKREFGSKEERVKVKSDEDTKLTKLPKKETAKSVEENSEARERDKEPEPPPSREKEARVPIKHEPKKESSNDEQGKASPAELPNGELPTKPAATAATKPNSTKEQISEARVKLEQPPEETGSPQQTHSELERLTPLAAGGRLLLHQQAEQERSRHNESPVILVERLNKPPAIQHHPLHQSYQPLQHRYLLDVQQGGRGGDEGLMDVEAGPVVGVPGSVPGSLSAAGSLRTASGSGAYGDSGSDSGVSSLRSAGSGDERSGSRSSAISAEEAVPAAAPARIWHVQSVQHTSLLMAHPQAPINSSAAAAASLTAPGGYSSSAAAVAAAHHHPGLTQDMIWRQPSRFLPIPPPGIPVQPSLTEVLERDRHERILRERREAEVRELESAREREAKQHERDRMEKVRAAEQAVHKHFEESLRLAQQKRNIRSMQTPGTMPWNSFLPLPQINTNRTHGGLPVVPFSSGPPPPISQSSQQSSQSQHPSVTVSSSQQVRDREREEMAREREREQQHIAAAEKERTHREVAESEYAQQSLAYLRAALPVSTQQVHVSRSSSVPTKVDYPPPAHTRTCKSTLPVSRHEKSPVGQQAPHSALPKAEPNVSLFGYSGYQPSAFVHETKVKSPSLQPGKSVGLEPRDYCPQGVLPYPPPLLPDHKSSVIVKNEAQPREPHVSPVPKSTSSGSSSRSPGPSKLTSSYHLSAAQQKPTGYECRSPSQSPHHGHPTSHAHHMDQKSPGHMAPGPAHSNHRQSQPHSRHSPQIPEPRYLSRPEAALPYAPQPKSQPSSQASYQQHYAAPPQIPKPKVSSPAPSHIYGKPNSGVTSPGASVPPSPASQVPLPLTAKIPSYQPAPQGPPTSGPHSQPGQYSHLPAPPPAHSSRPKLPLPGKVQPVHMLPPGPSLIPTARTPPQSCAGGFQTQPLDLGVERSGSPKRRPQSEPVSLEVNKKRRIEESNHLPLLQQTHHNIDPSPMLLRISEPSPSIASVATTVTTLANSTLQPSSQPQVNISSVSPAPRTGSADGTVRPSSAGSVGSIGTSNIAVTSTPTPSPAAPSASPAPSTAPSPAPGSGPATPAKPTTPAAECVDKSSSPVPRPPSTTSGSSYPVHKLKKAWVQRHFGEDGTEDTTGIVGSGSCVTLPLNIAQQPSTNGKDAACTTTSTTNSTTAVSRSVTPSGGTSLPCAVNSIHNIGSMAVNSINKTKVPLKACRKPAVKEVMNGHAPNTEALQDEDSSNSEPERKPPPKRKPPKVKRKKGAWKQQGTVQEQRRGKKAKQVGSNRGVTALSDSSNDSEAGSMSDSSEQLVTPRPNVMQLQTPMNDQSYKTSSGNGKKVPRKRGRKPRSNKDDKNKTEEEEEEGFQPRQKKKRIDKSNSGSNNNKNKQKRKTGRIKTIEDKPSNSELVKTGQSYVQDENCGKYTCTRISKCRECRMTPSQKNKLSRNSNNSSNNFCRFYAFRRMQYTKSGTIVMAGFNDPNIDCNENDKELWLPGIVSSNSSRQKYKEETLKDKKDYWTCRSHFDRELAHQILQQVGDQFCDLIHQEKNVVREYLSRGNDQKIVWKRVVKETREMCDICDTTLFNYHWTCGKCGFVVCIDCYEARENNKVVWTESTAGKDKFAWLLCANRQVHSPEQLLLTQVIPSDCLEEIDKALHRCRREWGIGQHCNCGSLNTDPPIEQLRNIIKGDLVSVINGNVKVEIKEEIKQEQNKTNQEDKSSLNWLADVALNQDKNDSCSDSDSDEDQDEKHSTLRELLIRPCNKSSGSGSRSNSPVNNSTNSSISNETSTSNFTKTSKKSKIDTLNEVISSVIESSVKKEEENEENEKPRELKHFVRRYRKWTQIGREPLPIRIMTLTESKSLYPEVDHSWLCGGKLLRLTDPNNPNNYKIFQDLWKRGQPVIVSNVHNKLDSSLWHPDSFSKDFGDQKNDLINCLTANIVPRQPMWKFWEGFEHSSKRLKDEQGNPMILKLKDWPSRGDFADILPTRFADLMKALPLSEYTHRYGRLNLTSRLPDIFTKPDLGPKMYNAYGSAKHPDKGTTNLHLDVSDAVNVMVYVGISKDGDHDEQVKEALKAIDDAGCDSITRRRVREQNELPGALWHIYHAKDADKIRDMLNAVAIERGNCARLEPSHDPIHDQCFYLDSTLRERLYREYHVEGYAIVQCLGDAVFIPAGAPHQVRNLHNCVKVAEDFVSPENISHCFHLTQEFRALSDTHTNHEDKLQIKNIVYHAVKDSMTALDIVKNEILKTSEAEKVKSST